MPRAALTLAVVAALAAGRAEAAPARSEAARSLQAARAHWADYDYEAVVAAADAAVAAADATPAQQVAALWLLGCARVVLEQEQEAAAAFDRLLDVDPDHRPRSPAPRFRAAFESARAAWLVRTEAEVITRYADDIAAMRPRASAPARQAAGRPFEVVVDMRDPGRIAATVVLAHRRRGQREFSTVRVPAHPGRLELRIPAAFLTSQRDYVLEWYLVIRHRSGATLWRQGGPDQPQASAIARLSTGTRLRYYYLAGSVAVGVGIAYALLRSAGGQHVEVGP